MPEKNSRPQEAPGNAGRGLLEAPSRSGSTCEAFRKLPAGRTDTESGPHYIIACNKEYLSCRAPPPRTHPAQIGRLTTAHDGATNDGSTARGPDHAEGVQEDSRQLRADVAAGRPPSAASLLLQLCQAAHGTEVWQRDQNTGYAGRTGVEKADLSGDIHLRGRSVPSCRHSH